MPNGKMKFDDLGEMAPMGFGSSAKQLLQLRTGKDPISIIVNSFTRGRLSPEDFQDLADIIDIATILDENGKVYVDQGTKDFIDLIVAGSIGEYGYGRGEFIQDDTGMVVPSSMPLQRYPHRWDRDDGKRTKRETDTRTEVDNEE